jgi:lycopene beta-cyclase
MTYFGFLLRFLVIPILVFLGINMLPHSDRERAGVRVVPRAVWIAILVHVFLAVTYTTPWDNYLVATGVWHYNPNLVTGIVFGYVPLEEYTFFVLETILAGLWWWFLARRIGVMALTPSPSPHSGKGEFGETTGVSPKGRREFKASKTARLVSFFVLLFIWAIFTFIFFSDNPPLTYLSITLFWALPPIFPQMLYGADILWHYRKLVALTILVPGTYLSLMDIVALRATTWSISPAQTTGILFFGILPVEEVVFFFITNILVSFGMTLLLAGQGRQRFADWKSNHYKGLP